MRTTTHLFLSLLLFAACATGKKTVLSKKQETENVVNRMFSALDAREWKDYERTLASRTVVFIDEPLLLKPSEVSSRLKPMIGYFDSSRHEISDFKLEEDPERLRGSAKFEASYWKNRGITSDEASVKGKATFEFVQEGEELRIMRMAMIPDKESGDRSMLRSARGKMKVETRYRTEIVDIKSRNGKKMRGWLYLPHGNIHDVVIINGNIGNIKEQGPHEYARHFADLGVSALVFDFVNFGESEGAVRNLEDPGQKISDFRGAVDFIANRKEFAASRISLAGLGISAAYIAAEAVNDPRIDRLLMISPLLPDLNYFQSMEFEASEKLRASREASHQFQQDGILTYIPVASYAERNAVLSTDPHSVDYYSNPERGNIPQWQNRFATMGWVHYINFDAISAASRIRIPTMIVRSETGPYPEGVQNFVSNMRVKPIEHVLSVRPYDFYDRDETLKETAALIEDFLNPSAAESEVTSL